jgi:hypothetical protein
LGVLGYIEQEVGGALDVMELIGGAEELLAVHKTTKIDKPVHMYPDDGTEMFVENLDNFQDSTLLIPEFRS